MPNEPPNITGLVKASSEGERCALDRLIEAAYPDLRAIARRYLKRERPDHTLQCTALINEAYLRLARSPDKEWNDRTHFFAFAATLMRGILVDHARARHAAKRGSGALTITLGEAGRAPDGPGVEVMDLHLALGELERLDAFQGRLVELRYFGGLSIEDTAEVMGVSASTVKREWILAKTWIRRRLIEGRRRS